MARLVLLLLILAVSVLYWRQQAIKIRAPVTMTTGNRLALGGAAKIDVVDIRINTPAELDRLSKDEVLRLRRQTVMAHPELLAADYVPAETIFGQIVDGAPWWGLEGQFRRGPGSASIDGPSEESRFILNPFLLVAPEFGGWWRDLSDAEAASFPFACHPQTLSWWPKEGRAEAVYSAACIARRQYPEFALIAYNARDLGLGYIYVSYADSRNVSKLVPPIVAYANPQFIHKGGSCGYLGGCNNMSPQTPPIDDIRLDDLPARIMVWLWRTRPDSVEVKPDFKYVIEIR